MSILNEIGDKIFSATMEGYERDVKTSDRQKICNIDALARSIDTSPIINVSFFLCLRRFGAGIRMFY